MGKPGVVRRENSWEDCTQRVEFYECNQQQPEKKKRKGQIVQKTRNRRSREQKTKSN